MFSHRIDSHQALENLPINVMICDAKDFIIRYSNRRSRETLNTIKHLLPDGVSGDTIVGQSIDVFHKMPEKQRKMLSGGVSLPHRAIIRLGDEFLSLEVSPLNCRGGKAKQFMLTWSVCSEVERLRRMADRMPINLMMCDPHEFRINYINQTSRDTLKHIEHLLPIKASDIEGACIDIFHKNPGRIRDILKNPKNLPHKAKIRLGNECLELNVAAIVSDDGYYVGPMVSWRLITEEMKMAENVKHVASMVSSASVQLSQNAEQTSALSVQTESLSISVSSATEEISATVQTVASAAEEMAASIKEISHQLGRSQHVVGDAVSNSKKADGSANALASAAQSIGNVVQFIQDIAEQINLLALNATIESARAGDAGRGFAVVASEVKNLAVAVTKATDDIAREIGGLQGISKEVVTSLSAIKSAIDHVNEYSSGIASAVEEQSAVTDEISANMSAASAALTDVSGNITRVKDASEQSKAAGDELLSASKDLAKLAEQLAGEVEKVTG